MSTLPKKLTWDLAQDRWASILNPVLVNPATNPSMLTNVKLINGATVINHLLAKQMTGWIVTDINAAATIYRSAPLNDLTLTLTSSAACVVNLMVY